MKSLEEISFGRRNYACPSGDTDIEPPAVFFHAALELEYITNDEFACLLWLLDSENKPFDQAIEYIRNIRREKKPITLPPEYQKNDDPKPIVVLGEWGVLQKIRVGRYSPHKISEQFMQRFDSRIRSLKLWNTAKAGPIPVKSALASISNEYSHRAIINDDEAISDSVYQDLVNFAPPSKTTYTPERYVPKHPDGKDQKSCRPDTNPSLGKEAIRDGKYKCTVDSSHATFVKKDGTKYMEVHHLIPLEFQYKYEYKLDAKANLIPVCPLCHKRLHYGRIEDITPVLTQFYNLRHDILQQSGLSISLEDLVEFYK